MKFRFNFFLPVVITLILHSCGNRDAGKPETVPIDPGFTTYISAFSGGMLPSEGVIRVVLVNEVASETMESVKPETLFSFSPTVKGKALWVDGRTLEFIPETPLKNGQSYVAYFQLGKVLAVEKPYEKLEWILYVIPQAMSLGNSELILDDSGSGEVFAVAIPVFTADKALPEKIAACFSAQYDGQKMPMTWDHHPDGKTHTATIENLDRKAEDSFFTLQWNTAPIGLRDKGSKKIMLPGRSVFRVTDVNVFPEPDSYIRIEFSAIPDPKQEINGLVYFSSGAALNLIREQNIIKVYPAETIADTEELVVDGNLRGLEGTTLGETYRLNVRFESVKPDVRWVDEGVILPDGENLILPFEAVNLSAVDVSVVQIYESNLTQFFQENDLSETYNLKRVGRLIYKKRVDLIPDKPVDFGTWNTFSLDLAKMIQTEPGAMYTVFLRFRKAYSLYPCIEEEKNDESVFQTKQVLEEDREYQYYDNPSDYYYSYEDYEYQWWQHRDDPCSDGYYNNKSIKRNVLASNVGVIAKKGTDNTLTVFVHDLLASASIGGARVSVLNYQQQEIASALTNDKGHVILHCPETPFLVVANSRNQSGYLRVPDGNALSLSRFDVSGSAVKNGLKGFIYGERGVWRPGDTLCLSFILKQQCNSLPVGHPVLMELIDPKGRIAWRQVQKTGNHPIHSFLIPTKPDDMSGKWTAKVTVGGASFTSPVRIETIKPNRLKIDFSFPADTLQSYNPIRIPVHAEYLHGAKAAHLTIESEITLQPLKTHFPGYEDYTFNHVAASLNTNSYQTVKTKLNAEGDTVFMLPPTQLNSSGFVSAKFFTRVYENNGEFSVDYTSRVLSPYKTYVGVRLPAKTDYWNRLETGVPHAIDVVTLDETGLPVDVPDVEVFVYKIEWDWWYESGQHNYASYVNNQNVIPVMQKKLHCLKGKASTTFEISYPDWGRYLVYVQLPDGNATGQELFVDWPGWSSRGDEEDKEGAALLALSSDKSTYAVGETACITFPGVEKGHAVITVENGTTIIQSNTISTSKGGNHFDFTLDKTMTPNVFVSVHLLQPHSHPENDLPLRMYGVLPVTVSDPETHLTPRIQMKDQLRSKEKTIVTVSEAQGRPMAYTLAVVDEGLLGLTRFLTPNPHRFFFAREALGVHTWDMYNEVMGAFTGNMASVFAIGGDENLVLQTNETIKRFKPVVRFYGPFELAAGASAAHSIQLPEYVGAVRVMVVAASGNAYGSAEKQVVVKDPLMVTATLPRTLAPNEEILLPVTVFAMHDKIQEVKVVVSAVGDVCISEPEQTLHFDAQGEKVVYFSLDCGVRQGPVQLKVTATSAGELATENIDIRLRNPNPFQTDLNTQLLKPGEETKLPVTFIGERSGASYRLEISAMPPLSVSRNLEYLMRYPHACAEQSVSAAFAQMLLPGLLSTSDSQFVNATQNVLDVIRRLRNYQTPQGGIALWPGMTVPDNWTSCYTAHFLLLASENGYVVPTSLKNGLLDFLASATFARDRYRDAFFAESYRLYVLALSGKPDYSAMNRLRENKLNKPARLRLAAAYGLTGKTEAAMELLRGVSASDFVNMDYSAWNQYYMQRNTGIAMALETAILLKDDALIADLAPEVAAQLSGYNSMNTHSTAWGLYAMWRLKAGDNTQGTIGYSYSYNGKEYAQHTMSAIVQETIVLEETHDTVLTFRNACDQKLFVNTIRTGQPLPGKEKTDKRNLLLSVTFQNAVDEPINPAAIQRGEDIRMIVTITHPGLKAAYKHLALTIPVPGGWEILSLDPAPQADYFDIRDDKVYVYFPLAPEKSISFEVRLHAAYGGTYYLPAVVCEAMYDQSVYAAEEGQWVKVMH
ncbi:MAG: alpha-2-macroglobulin family protein [Bacteroidales bacterium]|nr:alpha-2-macroglobulin family protein [Bacteroidales bacterium]MDY0285398.1 alpha-2-macroglobulin family protein [Bacteroidales bacterium]